jgi:hypothetical protein
LGRVLLRPERDLRHHPEQRPVGAGHVRRRRAEPTATAFAATTFATAALTSAATVERRLGRHHEQLDV